MSTLNNLNRISSQAYEDHFFKTAEYIYKQLACNISPVYQGINIQSLFVKIANAFGDMLLTPKECLQDLSLEVDVYSDEHSLGWSQQTITAICNICFKVLIGCYADTAGSPLPTVAESREKGWV